MPRAHTAERVPPRVPRIYPGDKRLKLVVHVRARGLASRFVDWVAVAVAVAAAAVATNAVAAVAASRQSRSSPPSWSG